MSDATLELMNERRKFKLRKHDNPDVPKHCNYVCRMVKKVMLNCIEFNSK